MRPRRSSSGHVGPDRPEAVAGDQDRRRERRARRGARPRRARPGSRCRRRGSRGPMTSSAITPATRTPPAIAPIVRRRSHPRPRAAAPSCAGASMGPRVAVRGPVLLCAGPVLLALAAALDRLLEAAHDPVGHRPLGRRLRAPPRARLLGDRRPARRRPRRLAGSSGGAGGGRGAAPGRRPQQVLALGLGPLLGHELLVVEHHQDPPRPGPAAVDHLEAARARGPPPRAPRPRERCSEITLRWATACPETPSTTTW